MINVLIADDNIPISVHLSNTVNTDEIRCVGIVNEGNKVIQRLEELRPEVLILDLKMPKMSGLEVLEQIERDTSIKTKVYIYSGEMEYIAKALKYKCVERYYSKTTPAEQIVRDIEESTEEISNKTTEKKVYDLLFDLGFKYYLRGTRLFNECIVYSITNHEHNIDKIIKQLADEKNENAYTIRSDINNAINSMWDDADKKATRERLQLRRYDKPGARDIAAMITYHINT